MQKWFDRAWFNFIRFFQWHRVLGVGGLCVVAYFLVFYVFGNTDVSGFLPPREAARFQWPDLPKFTIWKENSPKGGESETIYTVPTRQITPQERVELRATNQMETPAGLR